MNAACRNPTKDLSSYPTKDLNESHSRVSIMVGTALSSTLLSMFAGGSMKVSHVHCRVRDLPAAARWFQQVLQATPRG